MQNIVTLGEINDALKIAAVTAAQLADMGFAALANKPICEGLPPEESRRLRNAKLYPAESIGQIRVALAQRLAAPATMQASVSNATCQAAPAAVAVPDERAAFEAKFRNLDLSQKPDAWGHARYSHDAISLAWEAWQARAALAATPAATPSLISSLKSILADADAGPPTDSQWCCKECGQWTPWNHPEAHDHEDGCTAPREYAKRRDWKSRLSTLIAAIPAATAPVVLPKPEAVVSEVMELVKDWAQRDLIAGEAGIDALSEESSEKQHQEAKRLDGEAEAAYRAIEAKLRALLAGVSAPAAPTEQQILDAAEKAGLWPNTVQSWIPAFKRYHAALAAAPQAQADARDAELLTDSALLDAMEHQRIALHPEYEGPWDAEVYNDEGEPNHRGSGSTPREAIRAAIAAAKGESNASN